MSNLLNVKPNRPQRKVPTCPACGSAMILSPYAVICEDPSCTHRPSLRDAGEATVAAWGALEYKRVPARL
jgi:hypothetical protein